MKRFLNLRRSGDSDNADDGNERVGMVAIRRADQDSRVERDGKIRQRGRCQSAPCPLRGTARN